MSLHCWADLAIGLERQMTTGGRAKKPGSYSNSTIFGNLFCTARAIVKGSSCFLIKSVYFA